MKKIKLDDMYRAYACNFITLEDMVYPIVASEEKGYPCIRYFGTNYEGKDYLWDDGGGVMSIMNIPGKPNEILAIRDFYLKETPSRARLVWGKYDNGWSFKTLVELPFLHRFDVFEQGGTINVILCVIADHKDHKEDWSRSGTVYQGILPDSWEGSMTIEPILKGLYRNHGYFSRTHGDVYESFIASNQGIHCIRQAQNMMSISHISEIPTSEIAVLDIDGDEIDEMITIEPFHGDTTHIYKLNDIKKPVYSLPIPFDFGHALITGTFENKPCFYGGVRRVNSECYVITYEENEYKLQVIDHGGPANLAFYRHNNIEYLLSSNHTANEVALYIMNNE